ncbi:UNVERIFIED_CONTAM: putative late blight resistance proteinR1B-16 [Sesamum latifolium]|uniref:Late blight resistance proteinR1B-16 n=1 Tax=Sesamum latifolium TaxID=2727402 RepID=A0AAW2UZ82_9LAMI
MAYNLESLVQILEQILHSHDHRQPWTLDPNKRPQIQSLLGKSRFLKDYSENSSSAATNNGKQILESRIRDAAHIAEDILESHLVDQILSCSEADSFIFSPPDLEKVIEELDTIKEEMMTIMDNNQKADTSSAAVSSSRHDPNPKNIIVGVAEDLVQLKDRLTGRPSKALHVIPIVGMGGIGKTTLARNLYDDPSIISHFDTRAWATISQDYNKQKLRDVLLRLLGCVIGIPDDATLRKTDDELALCLHQALMGRRYLIILDDVWDVKPWDDIRRFFPDENNGSRIIVTTRESSMADYIGSGSLHHQMNLLKDDESWNLLRQKVFAPEETCSPELEKAKTSQDFWEQVSENVSSTAADKGESFSNILSLSYNHLPNHLKPCFLYMGTFPEDYEIHSSRLINLLAEGLVRPISDKTLEGAAEMHLKALVDRNLIFVHQQKTNGNVKSYSIHDLLRDLCVRKAHEEKFLYVDRWADKDLGRSTSCLRHVCYHGPFSIEDASISTEQIRLAHSFLLFDRTRWSVASPVISNLRLLRPLPSSISRLCNLQTLIAQFFGMFMFMMKSAAICGIVDMSQLRHIKVKQGTYVRYHGECSRNSFVILDKLQTLSPIAISEISDRVVEALPNLEKLGIFWDGEDDDVRDVSRLHKLHTLKCISFERKRVNFSSNLIFQPSIKHLTLTGFQILDDGMNEIGKLPNLEILKLRECDFPSGKWEAKEGEFCQLQFLQMGRLNLKYWAADEYHFPRLEHLVIRGCRDLQEIPLAIGDIPTLKLIEVDKYSPFAVASAREIQEAQLDIGNEDLQVRILGYY